MIGILTKNVIRIRFAPFRQRKKRITASIAVIMLSTLPLSLYLSMKGMFLVWQHVPGLGEKAVHAFFSFSFAGLFLLMLFTGFGSALHHLFFAEDLPLLLSLPIKAPKVFFVKFLESFISGSATFFIFGVPILTAFTEFSGADIQMITAMVIASILFIAAAAAVVQLIAAASGGIFNAVRLRKYAVMMSSIIAIALWAGLQWLRLSRFTPASPDFDPVAARRFFDSLSNVSYDIFPSERLVDAVFAVFHGNLPKAALHLAVLGVIAGGCVSAAVYWRTCQEPLLQFDARAGKRRNEKFRKVKRAEEEPLALTTALFTKEIKLALRDLRTRHVLLVFIVAMILWPLLQGRGGSDAVSTKWATAFFAAALSNILARQSIPQEKEAFVYTRLAPLSMRRFLLVKAAFVVILLGAAIVPGQVINTLKSNGNFFEGLGSFLLPFGCIILGTSIGIYSGARFGRFDWRDPRQMIGMAASYLSMIISLAGTGIGLGIWMTAELFGYGLAFGMFFLYVYVVFQTFLSLSQKHLSSLDWI